MINFGPAIQNAWLFRSSNFLYSMQLTDTHTHLYSEEFDEDRKELIESAIAKGVSRFFMPNIDSSSVEAMLELEEIWPEHCFPMMGLHPCSVKVNWKEEMEIVEQWLGKRKFIAIGEMGIDLFWDKTFVEEQKIVFNRQVELANKYKLPIVIHSRDSFEMIYDLLLNNSKQEPCGIFHCFTGTVDQAERAIKLGFYLGIGGVVSFKNAGLDKVLEEISLEHIVIETDAPYLAPVPHRGKRNLPEYIRLVAEKIAVIKNISVEEVAKITTENSKTIFSQ
jgi:TatD DNase family protein